MGPHFAKTRAMIFAVIGFIFLAAGVGVTVGTLDLAQHSGGKSLELMHLILLQHSTSNITLLLAVCLASTTLLYHGPP